MGENGDIMRRSEGLLDLYIVEREIYIYIPYISILKLHEEHNLQMRLRNVKKMSMNSYPLFIFLGVRGSKGPNIANIHMLVLFPEDRSPLCHRAATWSLIWLRESARVETWPLTGCVLLLDDHEVSWISHGYPMDFPWISHGFPRYPWILCCFIVDLSTSRPQKLLSSWVEKRPCPHRQVGLAAPQGLPRTWEKYVFDFCLLWLAYRILIIYI